MSNVYSFINSIRCTPADKHAKYYYSNNCETVTNTTENDEKKITYELLMDYCKYQNLPLLLKDLHPSVIMEKIKNLSKINYDAMIVLRNDIDKEEY